MLRFHCERRVLQVTGMNRHAQVVDNIGLQRVRDRSHEGSEEQPRCAPHSELR